MAFVELGNNGVKEYATAFDFLNSICNTFGMRCFFSNGSWQLVQVNYYDNWTVGNNHFYRYYNVANAATGSPDASGSTSAVVQEGTSYKRLGGADFDYLAVLKEVWANYDRLQTFNLPFLQYSNNSDTSTLFNPNFNEIPLWNGYRYNNLTFSGTGFDINNSKTDLYSVSLGSVTATDYSTLRFNRDFKLQGLAEFLPTTGAGNILEIKIQLRFRLVGDGQTKYAFIRNNLNEEWHTINPDFANSITFGNIATLLSSDNLFSNFTHNINCETQTIPFSGELFLDGYASIYYNTYSGQNAIIDTIQVTESTSDSENILLFSPPVLNQNQGVQYLVDGELSNLEIYIATNAPGGTAISTGVSYDVEDLFVGSSPSGIGRIEVYNFTTSAWESFNTTWKAFNTGTGTRITQLLVEEILKGQNLGARTFNGAIKITDKSLLPYYFGITIDGSNFVPYQCTFNGANDTWSGEWYEINTNSTGQTISVGTDTGQGVNNVEVQVGLWVQLQII